MVEMTPAPKTTTRTIPGPPTARVSQVEALHQLEATINENGVKGTVVEEITPVKGRWVAKIKEPVRRQAGPPPFADDSDSADGPSGPPSGPPESDGPPSDSGDDSSDGPPKDEKSEGKDEKGKQPDLGAILELLTQVAQAVGVPVPGAEGPAGDEPPLAEEPGIPKEAPIESPEGPPSAKKGPAGPGRPLKPGEVPNRPGAVPGLPAFSSDQNPFPEFIGQARNFEVTDDQNPGRSLVQARNELNRSIVPFGYAVEQIKPRKQANTDKRELAALVSYQGSVDAAAKQARLDPDSLEPIA